MNKSVLLSLLLTMALVVALVGCGPKPLKEASVLDTPENHYNQGVRELDRGNYNEAMKEFERAVALNQNFGEGFAGMALVYAGQADFKKAYEMVDKALDKNSKSQESRIAKGRIIMMEKKDEDWIKRSVKEFDEVIKNNANSAKAHFYKGTAYKEAYLFGDAAISFRKVIELKSDFAAEANTEWELVQKIERAAPGTKVGAKIALINEIDRADLAVLLIEELKLLQVIEKKRPQTFDTGFKAPDDPSKMKTTTKTTMAAFTDADNHWAKNWIKDIVEVQGMDVFPDRTFRPDEKITRANFAMTMQNIMMMVTGDETLATKYIGTPSRFPDLNPTHFAYNAICLMVDRGIMQANKMTGAFNLNAHVSGADALLTVRDFQNALRMTF